MKQLTFTTTLGCLCAMLAGTGLTTSVSADTASDCRQEAQDYGVAAEGLDDYINGCLASRGELIDSDIADMDYVPPEESGDLPDTQTDDYDAEQ